MEVCRRGGHTGVLPLVVAVVATLAASVAVTVPWSAPAGSSAAPGAATAQSGALPTFSYGFDLAKQGPYQLPGNDPGAVASARAVMASAPMVEAQQLMGSGVGNPEASPGVYAFGGVDRGIHLITSTGGTPVMVLFGAPDWMKGQPAGTTNWALQNVAPLPQYYQDFADLAATVALRYPQVKYFVVWKELQGFWIKATGSYDIASYTTMYNDVDAAIKAVRPDAMVGGPYTPLVSWSTQHGYPGPRPEGPWGYADWGMLQTIPYFLAHAVGIDFLALDAPNYTKDKGLLTDPVTSDEKFAAIDQWIRAQTALPMWWLEGPVGVINPGQLATAARVGALVDMAASGASVGMQWQPQEGAGINGEGVWTSTVVPGGGQPTLLAELLPSLLHVLRYPVAQIAGQPQGVVAVTGLGGTVAVNGTSANAVVTLVSGTVTLGAGGISIADTPDPPVVTTAVGVEGGASVSFDAPAYGGSSPVTAYTVTADDVTDPANGGQTASGQASPVAVNGLTDGDTYTFTVTATNAAGTGPSSAPSASVVPDPPPPTVSAVVGGPVPQGSDQVTLLVVGSNFPTGATARVTGGGVTLSHLAVVSPLTIEATATVSPSAATGPRNVVVDTPEGSATCDDCVAVSSAPELLGMTPGEIAQGAETSIQFSGSRIEPGATLRIAGSSGTQVALRDVVVASSTSLTAKATVAMNATTGTYSIVLTNPDHSTATCPGCLTVLAAPTVTAIAPSSVSPGQMVAVVLSGTGFAAGASVTGPAGTNFTGVSVVGPDTIDANLSVAKDAAAGSLLQVKVANDADGGNGRATADLLTIT